MKNSAKAIIVCDGRLLVNRLIDSEGPWFDLPGGGQESGETLEEALRRECREELSVEIEPGGLRFVCDYILRNAGSLAGNAQFHKVALAFQCSLLDGQEPRIGAIPDGGIGTTGRFSKQVGLDWLPLDALEDYRLYPLSMRPLFRSMESAAGARYLSDVHEASAELVKELLERPLPIPIRNSAKALIIRDGHLLVNRMENRPPDSHWFIVPGGGQEPGETLDETLRRECREEIGVNVQVQGLRLVRDYIGSNHEFAEFDSGHGVEFMFVCSLGDGVEPGLGPVPDSGPRSRQVGVEWLPIDRLEQFPLYPKALRPLLRDIDNPAQPVYLGDVN